MNIIISGSSRGIGLELAKQFSAAGHHVLALSRHLPNELLGTENVSCLSLDLSKEDHWQKAGEFIVRSWKKVDAVIHNAGAIVVKPFAELSPEEFRNVYDVNLFGVAGLNRIVLPYMHSGGHVVTISSMGGIQGAVKFAGLSAYSSSKAAVIGLSELLAEEYKEQGIAFNVLALGAVQTEMLAEAFPGYRAPVSAKEMAEYIYHFTMNGHRFHNGKVIQVSSSTP